MVGESSTFKVHQQNLPGISFSIRSMGRALTPAQRMYSPTEDFMGEEVS